MCARAGFFQSRCGLLALLEKSGPLLNRLRLLDAGCGFGTATSALLDALARKGVPLLAATRRCSISGGNAPLLIHTFPMASRKRRLARA